MTLTTPSIQHPIPPYPVRRFTVAEYHRLAEAGILSEDDRVELLEGWIVPKMVHNPPHDAAIQLVHEVFQENIPSPWKIRIQSAISTEDSEPEPDLAVVQGPSRRYADHHPTGDEIALIVEVAESSVERDRQKAHIYSRAGVAVYWIVNLVDGQIEVFSEPEKSHRRIGYRQHRVFSDEEAIPLEMAGQQITTMAAKDLLP